MSHGWRMLILSTLGASALAGCRNELRRSEDSAKEAAAPPTLASVGEEAVVSLDSETVLRIGLRTVKLSRATRPPERELGGVIIEDPGAVTNVRAGLGGRLVEAGGRRWPSLGERLETGTEIAQVGDARPVLVPRGGSVTRLLAQPGELVQAGQPLLELVDYSAPIARVAWTTDALTPPATITLRRLAGGARFTARLEGPAPEADPVTGGPAYLYRVRGGGSALRPGSSVIALLPDLRASVRGVDVPAEAVVQWESLAWAYVEREPGKFARVRVPTDFPVPGGWRVEHGLAPGNAVVVTGAEQLLSEEFRARIVVGEEVGE